MSGLQQTFYHLAVALALGLLIGLERGWQERRAEEGSRVAGVRTYGLIGLLGGVSAVLSQHLGVLTLGLAFVTLGGVLATVYVVNSSRTQDVGITSLVAGLLTFVFGALAARGEVAVATASAVVTSLLLSYKPLLHRWVQALEVEELHAVIKLLLVSVVLLPILPDQGYGPWQALNPYVLWWMVVLIALVSFVGYFAIKIGGPHRGAVFTGLFGGLASSTALTLHFSRMARRNRSMEPVLALAILLACGTMFPRMVLIATILNPALFKLLVVPAAVMALAVYLPALSYWRSRSRVKGDLASPLRNPLQLAPAVTFGALLALVLVLSRALQSWSGDAGVQAFAAASGVADVDAITLSLARMSQQHLAVNVAAIGLVMAAAANGVTKAAIASVIGGRSVGLLVGLPLVGSAVVGLITAWLWVW